jgi:3-hydroxypropanoate dehydrogenase
VGQECRGQAQACSPCRAHQRAKDSGGAGHSHRRLRSGFCRTIAELFPARGKDMQAYYSDPLVAQSTAFRNGSLQGAYLIIAARALGLDSGPMSGFCNEAVDSEFFANTRIKSNFICSVGYGSNENLFPRNPRLTFEEAGRFA